MKPGCYVIIKGLKSFQQLCDPHRWKQKATQRRQDKTLDGTEVGLRGPNCLSYWAFQGSAEAFLEC